mmetsp:Transcript_12155/g.37495  ORF Transcript_12155/g.37495 Transcript_12155/m.37495 type:complete len:276 (-) Transcript_12155:89-916(-)
MSTVRYASWMASHERQMCWHVTTLALKARIMLDIWLDSAWSRRNRSTTAAARRRTATPARRRHASSRGIAFCMAASMRFRLISAYHMRMREAMTTAASCCRFRRSRTGRSSTTASAMAAMRLPNSAKTDHCLCMSSLRCFCLSRAAMASSRSNRSSRRRLSASLRSRLAWSRSTRCAAARSREARCLALIAARSRCAASRLHVRAELVRTTSLPLDAAALRLERVYAATRSSSSAAAPGLSRYRRSFSSRSRGSRIDSRADARLVTIGAGAPRKR